MGTFNEYASKGVAGSGLGLGIAGTALGVLNSMNNGNGLLGGLFGGNYNRTAYGLAAGGELQYVSQLQAENAMLKSENYADKVGKETYSQTRADNKELRDELYAFIKPLAEEAANNRVAIATLQAEQKCCCEKQELQAQITAGKINETALALNGKIDTLSANYKGAFDTLNQTLACISGKVDHITNTIVPITAVCPQPMPRYNGWCDPKDCSNNGGASK